jgi:hypothetical protein
MRRRISKFYKGDHLKESEKGGTGNMHGGNMKCTLNVGKTEGEKEFLKTACLPA